MGNCVSSEPQPQGKRLARGRLDVTVLSLPEEAEFLEKKVCRLSVGLCMGYLSANTLVAG